MAERKKVEFESLMNEIVANPKKWMKRYRGYLIPAITIENYDIEVISGGTIFNLEKFTSFFESLPRKEFIRLHFLNNKFTSDKSKQSCPISLLLLQDSYITFDNNIFDEVALHLVAKDIKKISIELRNNICETQYVSISTDLPETDPYRACRFL